MDLLATLFLTMHIANPFAVKPMPNFYVAPSAPVVVAATQLSMRESQNSKRQDGATPSAATYNPIAAPTPAIPPHGWDATNAPGMGVTCWSTTQCLNEYYGVSNDGGPGQPGYLAVCPDGVPAQGSCQTPGGEK